MLQEFKRLPLTSSFDSDINDFLFEETPLIPLPQTGQPIVGTQANAQQTGQTKELTATELALLSPSEQIIRLRDKNKGTA